MDNGKAILRDSLHEAIQTLALRQGIGHLELSQIQLEVPPDPTMGDLAFPCFPLAKGLKMPPATIAKELLAIMGNKVGDARYELRQAGPYINAFYNRASYADGVFQRSLAELVSSTELDGKKVMIEFSCPNTNKPLHLGHLRNDALGESCARIMAAAGAKVRKVNLINNRGIHICKSMLAYMELGEGKDPSSSGTKGDHFVGSYYVAYKDLVERDPETESRAQGLLKKWEDGDKDTLALWNKMNEWTISGMEETYRRTGISFDHTYLESETYLKGRDQVIKGLERGIFFRAEDGSIRVDLSPIGLENKVLLRSDGTSIYMTQDIGTAIDRHGDWPFDRLIYVVASEQQYHFKVLFYVLGLLGYEWAHNLYHLSYGLVNLPEGRMKTREGTVVDADDLLDQLESLALAELSAKGREEEVDDPKDVAAKVALAALHYYLLQTGPTKDMVFNPKESLSFNGNTGPYIQYMGARIESILRKAEGDILASPDPSRLVDDREWALLKLLNGYSDCLGQAAKELNPALLCGYVYDLASCFSRYYHDIPILKNDDAVLVSTRIALCTRVLHVLRSGMELLLIPSLRVM